MSIRDLDDGVHQRLRVRAAHHGRSMEAEARAILSDAVAEDDTKPGFVDVLIDSFAALGGVDLDIDRHGPAPRAAPVG